MNTRCNERVNANSNYYVGTSDAGVLNGSPSYTIDHIHRGYLCETRVIHTVAGNILCIFPFRYSFLIFFSLSSFVKI